MQTSTIAIIGAGNMGTSLLGGLIANQFPASQLWITDPDSEKLHVLEQQFNIQTALHNNDAVNAADVIILAVKPQMIANVMKEIAISVQTKKTLVISVAAGIRIDALQNGLGNSIPIVRCMPNTPALIRAGVTAMYANSLVTDKQRDLAESILRAVGMVVWLEDEKLMDAVTALSGSGPAYFFLMIEALQHAGETLGLPRETARLLTLQTALGAARMAFETDVEANELCRRVTSKGGTTEAALRVLENGQLRDLFLDALKAAKARSEELAELFGKEVK